MTAQERSDILDGIDAENMKLFAIIISEAGTTPTEAEVDAVCTSILNNSYMFGQLFGTAVKVRKTKSAAVAAVSGATPAEIKALLDAI